jgi:hypothetical protein
LAPTVDRTAMATILDCFTPHDSRAQVVQHQKDRDPAFADNPLKKPSDRAFLGAIAVKRPAWSTRQLAAISSRRA